MDASHFWKCVKRIMALFCKRQLRSDSVEDFLGADLPHMRVGFDFSSMPIRVRSGSGTLADPLFLASSGMGGEYDVIDDSMAALECEWELSYQALVHHDGRYLDEIGLRSRPSSSANWTAARLYFDITESYPAGFVESAGRGGQFNVR